jgi:hypothetical protein
LLFLIIFFKINSSFCTWEGVSIFSETVAAICIVVVVAYQECLNSLLCCASDDLV